MRFNVKPYQKPTFFSKVKGFFNKSRVPIKEFLGFDQGKCIFRLVGNENACELQVNSENVVLTAEINKGLQEVLHIGREKLLWNQENDGSLHVIGEVQEWEQLWRAVGR